MDPAGIITTVAGSGHIPGYDGDRVPAASAMMQTPGGCAVDPDGNIYIADTGNSRVRKVSAPTLRVAGIDGGSNIAFSEGNGQGHILSPSGIHLATIDLDSGVKLREFEYDSDNRIIAIADQFKNTIQIERDGIGVPTALISPDGIRTDLIIDENNHLRQIIYPDGSTFEFEYTPDGLETKKIQPEGNAFGHLFDSIGRISDFTDDEGGHWEFSRWVSQNGNVVHKTETAAGDITAFEESMSSTGAIASHKIDPAGAVSQFSRSDDGLLEAEALPCGNELTAVYDLDPEYKNKYVCSLIENLPSGLKRILTRSRQYQDENLDGILDVITETIGINNKTTTSIKNIQNSTITITSPEGRKIEIQVDPLTNSTLRISVPGVYGTDFTYDARGRVKSATTRDRTVAYSYLDDTNGHKVTVTDPFGNRSVYESDSRDRLSAIGRADGGLVEFDYDQNGNMTLLVNPSGVSHEFAYNRVNHKSGYLTPLSGAYAFSYDQDRRLTGTRLPSGKQITHFYSDGRIVRTDTPDGSVHYSYAPCGNLSSTTKGSERVDFAYDGDMLTDDLRSGTLNQSILFTYNTDFLVSSITCAGDTISLDYDHDGLLTAVGNFTISRNADNGLPEVVSDGSLNVVRTFDGYGELAGIDHVVSGQSKFKWDLNRDAAGRIVKKSETVDGTANSYDYTYDTMGRLLTVTRNGTLIEEYRYDGSGIRIFEMNAPRGISSRSYSYSEEDHLLSAGNVQYHYDPDGFLFRKIDGTDMTEYSYSSGGELLAVALPNGHTIEYLTDPLGRHIAKKVDGLIREKYLWHGMTQLLAVFDGSEKLMMRFQYADDRLPFSVLKAGVTYYLAYDQVGSLRSVADSGGNVIKSIDYDAFGNRIFDSNPAFEMPLGFAGGLHDPDTGLVRFGHRDYDPDVGRWTAKDPIGFAGGDTDLYGYVLNDPINLVDPFGLFIKHLFEDKLPSWLRDKRTDEQREAAHQAYNKDLQKRFSQAAGYIVLHSKMEKAILQPVYKIVTLPVTSIEENTRPPWWPPFSPAPYTPKKLDYSFWGGGVQLNYSEITPCK